MSEVTDKYFILLYMFKRFKRILKFELLKRLRWRRSTLVVYLPPDCCTECSSILLPLLKKFFLSGCRVYLVLRVSKLRHLPIIGSEPALCWCCLATDDVFPDMVCFLAFILKNLLVVDRWFFRIVCEVCHEDLSGSYNWQCGELRRHHCKVRLLLDPFCRISET